VIGLVEVAANVNGKIVHKPAIELEEANANVKRRLANNHMVALVGVGGVGKTTLMKELYCQIHVNFKKSSFLENVKESDIVEVQKKLIMDLCGLKL
jgi:ABC-type phosphate/phosphonate transport system ATPase subunit